MVYLRKCYKLQETNIKKHRMSSTTVANNSQTDDLSFGFELEK